MAFLCHFKRFTTPYLDTDSYSSDNIIDIYEACNSTKIYTPPSVFFTFFKLYRWYQSRNTSHICGTYMSPAVSPPPEVYSIIDFWSGLKLDSKNWLSLPSQKSLWTHHCMLWQKLPLLTENLISEKEI